MRKYAEISKSLVKFNFSLDHIDPFWLFLAGVICNILSVNSNGPVPFGSLNTLDSTSVSPGTDGAANTFFFKINHSH